jgi:hypothetical protein
MFTPFHVGAPPVLAAVVAEEINATIRQSPVAVVTATECGSVVATADTADVLYPKAID